MRALIDAKGEVFATLRGKTLYTLDDEPTGRIEGEFVVDLSGKPIWRISGDGVYTIEGFRHVGYFGSEMPEAYEH